MNINESQEEESLVVVDTNNQQQQQGSSPHFGEGQQEVVEQVDFLYFLKENFYFRSPAPGHYNRP